MAQPEKPTKIDKDLREIPLLNAAAHGDTKTFERLLAEGESPNICNWNGRTAAHWAAYGGSVEILKVIDTSLLSTTDDDGELPAHYAALNGRVDVLNYLRKNNIAINLPDPAGDIPLHSACALGEINSVKWFLKYNKLEQFNVSNKEGHTPLSLLQKDIGDSDYKDKRAQCLNLLKNERPDLFTDIKTVLADGNSMDDGLPTDDIPPDVLPPNDLSPDDPYFIKAIAEGSGYLKPAVVIIHGPPGAGKTSVKQLFLDRPPLHTREQNSTDILERPITTYTVTCDGINTLCEVKEDDFQQILLSSIHDKANDLRSKTNKPQQYRSNDTSYVHPPSTTLVHQSTLEQTPQIDRSNSVKLLKKILLSTAKSSRSDLFNLDWIYLVDSGGQPQFSDVLPLLFRSEALYIVVIRLDQDLDVKQNNCYCLNGKKIHLPEKLNLSTWEMIEKTCQIAEAQSSETSPKQVMIITTHIDKVSNPVEREERVKEFDIQLKKLQTKYGKVLVTKDIQVK